MPITVPADLPGLPVLRDEGVAVMSADCAARQDIRPLRLAIMNLMPDKIGTEVQLLRALGATPLQLEVTLLHAGSHESKNTNAAHLTKFYQTADDVAGECFDGLIVTGAPVEQMPFADVDYWPELQRTFDWAARNVHSTLSICWGAQAALHHYHGVDKHILPAKHSGVFPHDTRNTHSPLTAGFDDRFGVPVSRHTEVRAADIAHLDGVEILADSPMTGLCLLHEPAARRVYMFNHLEYDADTLKKEFDRDVKAGMNPAPPYGYFPDNDPQQAPSVTWRAHRSLLFRNWVDTVYQGTPFRLEDIPKRDARKLCLPGMTF